MGTAEALRLQQLLGWLGEVHRIELFSDSAAARLQVKLLWVQRLVNEGAILISKLISKADIETKALAQASFEKQRGQLGFGSRTTKCCSGRCE